MRVLTLMAAAFCGLMACNAAAQAAVTIQIDLSAQRMHVTSGAGETYDWSVSTARSEYVTPHGFYQPQRLEKMHYSREYHMSPMPHSIFFHGGYAIHGTYSVAELGRPASHGCIRLAPGNAALLYSMVQHEGARISITGTPPSHAVVARAHGKGTHVAARHRHHNPLAYAPVRQAPPLQQWFAFPGREY